MRNGAENWQDSKSVFLLSLSDRDRSVIRAIVRRMLTQARLFVGRGRLHWYDFVFIGLAAVIVYPDEILDWIGARTGKHFTWVHVLLLEAIAVAAVSLFDWYLLAIYPKLYWWMPLLYVGMIALFRGIRWIIGESLGD